MPHVLYKGMLFSFLESRYADPAERQHVLRVLYANQPNLYVNSGTLNKASVPPGAHITHLYVDWFGYHYVGGTWTPAGAATTGWWSHWKGDAHEIFRVTLIRAIEVSLGYPYRSTSAAPPAALPEFSRNWRINFLWVCGSPKFEGWVSWRKLEKEVNEDDEDAAGKNDKAVDEDGVVQVLFVTPPIDDNYAGTPGALSNRITYDYAHPGPPQLIHDSPDYADEFHPPAPPPPLTFDRQNGLWVIGHDVSSTPVPGPSGSSTNPYELYYDGGASVTGQPALAGVHGGIVTVQPAEEDGGVLSAGRAW